MRKKSRIYLRTTLALYGFFSLTIAVKTFAHTGAIAPVDDSNIIASASVTYRSNESIRQDQVGFIPGALIGGEALPVNEGFALDDAQLYGTWTSPSNYSVHGILSAHHHSGGNSVDLESLWLQFHSIPLLDSFNIEVGKMSTATTSLASWHASKSLYSEASLLADVLWGRHFTDVGIRIRKNIDFITAGIEVWDGNSWPAYQGKRSWDGFIQYRFDHHNILINGGLWKMYNRAVNRTDNRYDVGHHSNGSFAVNPSADYSFFGRTDMVGFYNQASLKLDNGALGGRFEWIQQSHEGSLEKESQQSILETDYRGLNVDFFWQYNLHRLGIMFERLTLENRFLSPVSSTFIDSVNLRNNGFQPKKIMFSWRYLYQPGLTIRNELVSERSYNNESTYRYNIGVSWHQKWSF